MLRFIKYCLFIGILILACQPKPLVKHKAPTGPPPAPVVKPLPDSAWVLIEKENVRESPNSTAFGTLHKNEKIYVMGHFGNWILFHNSRFDSVFVWGPSVGINYINIYNPLTYYDTTYQQFYSLVYLQQLLGVSGKTINDNPQTYQVFFDHLGLGSHQEIVMEVTTESTEKIQHGITITIRKSDELISRVEVDYLDPIKGTEKALSISDLKNHRPSSETDSAVIWKAGTLVPGLIIQLERKEWKSPFFRTVSFQKKQS
jgi:hypothetical protein